MFQKIKNWFIYSSANPQEFALTLKAFIPFLALIGLGQFTEEATSLVGVTVNWVVLIGQFISLSSLTHGIVRKIWLTTRPN